MEDILLQTEEVTDTSNTLFEEKIEEGKDVVQQLIDEGVIENGETESKQSDTVSGGNVNYNIYYNQTVSMNREDPEVVEPVIVSSNILDKPVNEYTVTESLFLFSIVIALFVLFVLLVRRSVFKWK